MLFGFTFLYVIIVAVLLFLLLLLAIIWIQLTASGLRYKYISAWLESDVMLQIVSEFIVYLLDNIYSIVFKYLNNVKANVKHRSSLADMFMTVILLMQSYCDFQWFLNV